MGKENKVVNIGEKLKNNMLNKEEITILLSKMVNDSKDCLFDLGVYLIYYEVLKKSLCYSDIDTLYYANILFTSRVIYTLKEDEILYVNCQKDLEVFISNLKKDCKIKKINK